VVTASVSDRLEITVAGPDPVPLDERHLVYRAMARGFEEMGCAVPGVRLRCTNVIPHARGLGSSSAAIVAGLAAARGLVSGGALLLDDDALFAVAADLEGHPDNVAPAVYGGFTVAYSEGGVFRATTCSVDPRVEAVVLVPPQPVQTSVARGLLPGSVPHRDAAANAARAALLVAALAGRPGLLLDATRDWLHQDYRREAMPLSVDLVHSLRESGLPAVVSGAGPSVLVLCDGSTAEEASRFVPEGWQVRRLGVDRTGVTSEPQ
jgi:homoserine kinase